MNYLNEKMTFNAISQCKKEMKTFPTLPKFETLKPNTSPQPMGSSDLQSRRESNPSRNFNRKNQSSHKYFIIIKIKN